MCVLTLTTQNLPHEKDKLIYHDSTKDFTDMVKYEDNRHLLLRRGGGRKKINKK